MRSWSVAAIICVLLLLVSSQGRIRPAASEEPGETAEKKVRIHAAIILRAVAYERNLATHPGDLHLTVLQDDSPDSVLIAQAFSQLAHEVKVAGRTLNVDTAHLGPSGQVLAALEATGSSVVYVPAGQTTLIEGIHKRLAAAGAMIVCADASDVGHGCVLSLEQADSHSRIVIHLGLAQEMGLHFDGRLLQLARVLQ